MLLHPDSVHGDVERFERLENLGILQEWLSEVPATLLKGFIWCDGPYELTPVMNA